MKILNILLSLTNKVCQHVITFLDEASEPKIWQTADRQGNVYWQAHDPSTGHSSSFGSEAEVLSWIEQRYYK